MRRHDPEVAPLLQPSRALVAQQRAADLAGIVARADADDLETFRMLVTAELIGKVSAHAVDHRSFVGLAGELEDGVNALPEFGIGQADDDAGAHLRDAP